MQFELNKTYSGFRLIKEKKVKEINSTLRLFEHLKSGARLLNVENDDDNKVFSISFRTPPKDSTGTPHILEHSVLCGSRKFPSKEPFVDLIKGSLNTFLNAFTFSDKTMYPVASKNEKDFFNLMDVYLDAALYPNIYKIKEIFMQEGWHYELNKKEDNLTYKGVVFNEMQGAFSQPESILMRKIQQYLFPDTPYGFESGGDPDIIPQLSWENFLAFHKKYYHPSNSYIYLYGNGNLMEELKFIDGKYLKDFDRINVDSKIPEQKPFDSMKDIVENYPITPDESEIDKAYLSMSFVTGKSTNPEEYLALSILEHLLLDTEAAPLRKALIDAGIGKDVFGMFDSSIYQPTFGIVVKNSNADKKEEFKKVVFNTLHRLVKDGIDKKLIEASINVKEFELREAEEPGIPKGLLFDIKLMDSWLHDEDPAMHLSYESTLNKIKEGSKGDYFEKLIQKYLLDNKHSLLLTLKPQKGLLESRAKEVSKKLSDYKESLSSSQIDEIIRNTQKLKKRQSEPDSPEDAAKIPMLAIEDINKKTEKIAYDVKDVSGVKVLYHPEFTNKISYISLLFNTECIPDELLPYAGLLANIIGKSSTEKYNYEDLSKEININTGGIRAAIAAYEVRRNDEDFHPEFFIKSKVLTQKMPELMNILTELTGKLKLDEKKRMKEIIQEIKSRLEMSIFDRGHAVVSKRVFSYFSPVENYVETTSGLSYYKFVSDIEKHFDERIDEVISNLQKVSDLVFNKDNLLIGITCSDDDYGCFEENIRTLIDGLKNDSSRKEKCSFKASKENEGLLTPGNVQYVAKGFNYKRLGYNYSGKMQVLKTIISLDYLWNRVRVQGGAYGGFAYVNRDGNVAFASYRDPNLVDTLNVYNEVSAFIKNFSADKKEMTKYIIGTIGDLDTPLSPSMKGDRAIEQYLGKISDDEIQNERDEILSTTDEDIRKFAQLFADVMKQNYICVLGNELKIKDNKEIFNKLVNVFE